jgi:4-hydroxyproline epimerase
VVDSHTEGEPTRVVIAGGPELGDGPMPAQEQAFRRDHSGFGRLVLEEPRGSPVAVGALLRPVPARGSSGVIFFDNAGDLGMCGHGTIGVMVTLRHLGRLVPPCEHVLETPVGPVHAVMNDAHSVTFTNVPSSRYRTQVPVEVPGHGTIRGDVAWGGNWFFIVDDPPIDLLRSNIEPLMELTRAIRGSLVREGVTGESGADINHIELSAPSPNTNVDRRNFVLCPGYEYDRSPCGTGTSAKMACLYADGKLREGEPWRQESILGTRFEGLLTVQNGSLIPSIRGSAYITGEGDLVVEPEDPLVPDRRP